MPAATPLICSACYTLQIHCSLVPLVHFSRLFHSCLTQVSSKFSPPITGTIFSNDVDTRFCSTEKNQQHITLICFWISNKENYEFIGVAVIVIVAYTGARTQCGTTTLACSYSWFTPFGWADCQCVEKVQVSRQMNEWMKALDTVMSTETYLLCAESKMSQRC